MIAKTLKTTEGKINIMIPSTLAEVTLGQMIEIQEMPALNDLGAISILSGLSLAQLQNVQNINDFQAFGDTILLLSHQIKHLYKSDAIPKKITFALKEGSKTVNIISNLSVEPVGAFMAARDIIAEEINGHTKQHGGDGWEESFNPTLKACGQVLAHYFYCKVTGKKYNEYEAEEFCDEIKKLRVTEALPIAKHFFTCYPGLSKQRTSFLHRLRQHWRKRQEYNRLKSLSISIQ
jgi:hypothetical protein